MLFLIVLVKVEPLEEYNAIMNILATLHKMQSSANMRAVDLRLSVKSFMYIRNSKGR